MGPNGLEKVNKKMFSPCDSNAMNDLKGIIWIYLVEHFYYILIILGIDFLS